PAERIPHDHGFHRAGAEATVIFRKRQAQKTLLGELAPDGFAPAALLFHVFLAGIEIVSVAEQSLDAFLEQSLLLRQIEIHFYVSLTANLFFHLAPLAGRGRRAAPDEVQGSSSTKI